MTRRNPRDGLRDRWVQAVLASDIGGAAKLLMMVLASQMSDRGTIAIPRSELAALLNVHPQRVSERIGDARRAGLLDQAAGSGRRGTIARYIATIPDCLPLSGNQTTRKVTGERSPEIGNLTTPSEGVCLPPSGNHNARALSSETKQRPDNERNSRNTNSPQERSDKEEPPDSPLAAPFVFEDHRATATQRRKAEQ